MGRKIRGALLKAKKRARDAQQELVEETAHKVETHGVTSKPDAQLFLLDTTAVATSTIPPSQEGPRTKKMKPGLSVKDQEQIEALLDKHGRDPETWKKLVPSKSTQRKQRQSTNKATFDLWDESDVPPETKSETTTHTGVGSGMAGTAPSFVTRKVKVVTTQPSQSTLAVQVAHAGQSYHPDPQHHQDIIGEALSLELRRKEALEYVNTPISQGMNPETKALMVGDSDSDSEEEMNDDDDDMDETKIKKKPKKLTRAQRNRQKRIRAERKEVDDKRRAKKQRNAIAEVTTLKKQLNKKEEADKARQELLTQLQQQNQRPLGKNVWQHRSKVDPLNTPTFPVALSSDLVSSSKNNNSLRTMKPKGSLLTDRMESFKDRKMALSKRVGDSKKVTQGNKRRLKVKAKGHDINITDEQGQDYLLMG